MRCDIGVVTSVGSLLLVWFLPFHAMVSKTAGLGPGQRTSTAKYVPFHMQLKPIAILLSNRKNKASQNDRLATFGAILRHSGNIYDLLLSRASKSSLQASPKYASPYIVHTQWTLFPNPDSSPSGLFASLLLYLECGCHIPKHTFDTVLQSF
jgi:hypothetical protein